VAVLDVIQSQAFQQRFFFLAKRFIAGETVDQAMDAVAGINAQGMSATLDFLGEDVTSGDEAARTCQAYFELLAAIRARPSTGSPAGDTTSGQAVDTNVSVKLTAIGLLVDEDFALANLRAILAAAALNRDPFVRIDMEGSAVTDATLRVFERAYAETKNVGPALQAYLRRTPADVERTIALGARVRLCKGAYNEPPAIAYTTMAEIRREYLRCAESLLERGNYPGLATHDQRLIAGVETFARERSIPRARFEFQMLYGVRPELQRRLVADGYRVRVYVPYGTHWAGYFYRRITERRENALFALRSLFSR
jgi:proline dehydrogenase